MKDDLPLRDFRYLDSARVQSLLSQVLEGAPATVEEATSSKIGGGLRAVLELGGERSSESTETRSIHHFAYTLLEKELDQRGRLSSVEDPNDFDELADGNIVRATGALRTLDPAAVAAVFGGIPAIFEAASLSELDKSASSLGGKKRDKAVRDAMTNAMGMPVESLGALQRGLDTVFGDSQRFRLHPWQDDEGRFFSGVLQPEHLTADEDAVFVSGAYVLAGAWTVVGVVTKLEQAPTEQDGTMESLVLKLLAALADLNKLVAEPPMPLIPLAVYREL